MMSIKFIHSVEIIFLISSMSDWTQVWNPCGLFVFPPFSVAPPPPVTLNVLQFTVFLQVQNCPSPENPAAHKQL